MNIRNAKYSIAMINAIAVAFNFGIYFHSLNIAYGSLSFCVLLIVLRYWE